MQIIVEEQGDVTIVTIPDSFLDASNVHLLRDRLAPIIEQHRKLVFDMGQLQFVDSAGFSVILSSLKRLNAIGGDLKLCNVTKPVRLVLELIRLHKIVDMFNSREEAVQAFAAGS